MITRQNSYSNSKGIMYLCRIQIVETMAKVELIMPKMGESIVEATILNWVKNVGDNVQEDETILEIATDKVDSEIPSPVSGKIVELLFHVDDVVEIGKTIAIIETDQVESEKPTTQKNDHKEKQSSTIPSEAKPVPPLVKTTFTETSKPKVQVVSFASSASSNPITTSESKRFYSPLVRNIAAQNGLNIGELDAIPGTGANGRLTKNDILQYIQSSTQNRVSTLTAQQITSNGDSKSAVAKTKQPLQSQALTPMSGEDEIIVMDRMRKLIANHMVMSKQTSPHVTSFIEVDVTEIVEWRTKIKKNFQANYGQNITYTPIFIQAVVKAIHDFPMVNVSVEGETIIKKNRINIGMAAAMKTGNLIVPVIKNADQHSLLGLTKQVNDLAFRARNNQLKADEIQDGTFTITNVGTFGNVMGTPIINQPQVAILAVGAIRKKPAVIETDKGDFIGIRHMMFMSLSYDHRVVDGFLGGSFLRRIADYLEAFDASQNI